MPSRFAVELNVAAIACVKALANLSGKSVLPNDDLAQLRRAVEMVPRFEQDDPYAGPTVVELSSVYANSWHRAVCDLVQQRLKFVEEGQRGGQCLI